MMAVVGWILAIILFIILGLILLVIFLSIVPIKYEVNAATFNFHDSSTKVRVSYLFRIIIFIYEYDNSKTEMLFKIIGFPIKIKTPETSIKEAVEKISEELPKPDETKKKEDSGLDEIINIVNEVLTYPHRKTIMGIVLKWFKKISVILKPKQLSISGTIGFADPALTGMLIGFYEALAGVFKLRRQVRLAGDFSADATEVKLNIFLRGKLCVARLIWPTIWLVLQKPVRGLLKDFF